MSENKNTHYCPICGWVACYWNDDSDCRFCDNPQMIDTHKTVQQWCQELHVNNCDDVEEYIYKNYIEGNPQYDIHKENKRLKELLIAEEVGHREYKKPIPLLNIPQSQSQTTEKNIPRCPVCNSTNIEKISAGSKIGHGVAFGLFGMGTISKTWRCKNCGTKF